jgi:hypothetical protein
MWTVAISGVSAETSLEIQVLLMHLGAAWGVH